jgi:hypothetical protein
MYFNVIRLYYIIMWKKSSFQNSEISSLHFGFDLCNVNLTNVIRWNIESLFTNYDSYFVELSVMT